MRARLREVVDTWRDVRKSSGKIDKRRRMAALFARLEADDLRLATAYLSGDLAQEAPGVGWALLDEALDATTPSDGGVTLAEVDHAILELGGVSGAGSVRRRLEIFGGVLGRSTVEEREFLAALLLGELRQGASKAIVVEALAEALSLDAQALRRAVMLAGGVPEVAAAARREGAGALARFTLSPLTPIEPMLASPAEDVGAALAELGGEASAEWKLDGIRVQLHKRGDDVRLYSRALHDITAEAPALVAFGRSLPAGDLVLDGELVSEAAFFDVLLVDRDSLIDRPYRERRAALDALLPESRRVPNRVVRSADEVRAVLDESLGSGHEGILLKALEAPYAAGRRGANWKKLKPSVTIDLVILGAEWGHGRRRGLLSNLHLGCRDGTDANRFWMLGKTFKGMTDAMLRELTEALPPLALSQDELVVLVRPERVVEIAFDAVFASTRYDSGFAFRFARVKRFRPDKRASEVATLDEIRRLAREL
jgi:DNA ligase 1